MRTQQQQHRRHRPTRTVRDHAAASKWWGAMDPQAREAAIEKAQDELGPDVSVEDAMRLVQETEGDRPLEPEPVAASLPEAPGTAPGRPAPTGDALHVENALLALVADGVAGVREAVDELNYVEAGSVIVGELEDILRRMNGVVAVVDELDKIYAEREGGGS